ncbi:MAG: TrkA family potassium uptake protein, partial [bacterium]
VGNGMNSEILKQANIEEADAIIITISADEAAIMVTLMARELNDHAQILVQVNQSASIESVYRARANYVQSLSQIAGRKLGEEVLGKEIFDPQLNVKIHRESGEIFAGQNLSDLDIGNQYQLSVVAVIRNGELITDFSSDFSFEPDDDFFVAGTDESVKQFMDHHGLQED